MPSQIYKVGEEDKSSSSTFRSVRVNKEQCLGCGLCESLCPEIFEMKDSKSQIKNGADFDKNKTCLVEAIETCPVKAIEKNDN